jgi:pimeloyl-ACP methyl ester carboxylesterase
VKPSLVILHGALGCAEQFREWKNFLDGKYECHLFNFPGHGSRSNEPVEFSIENFSNELGKYIQERKLEKPHVLGYSMGGYIALCFALKDGASLGKIVTIATKFDWNPETANKEAGYLEPNIIENKIPQLAIQLKERHGDHWKNVTERTAAMMRGLGENPLLTTENIKIVDNQVRFCVGDKDKMVGVQETFSMYRNATNASFCVMPDTAHVPEKMSLQRISYELDEFFFPDKIQ